MRLIVVVATSIIVLLIFFASITTATVPESVHQEDWIKDQLGNGLNPQDKAASDLVAGQVADQISNIEWLAPLAPIALSPFFGITLLSGLACYGPDWLPNNALLSEGSPLANPTLFWIFLALTVITSAPRFSKISKPVAQFADFLETYSAIVILLALKIAATSSLDGNAEAEALLPVQAGILSIGWDGLMMLAMAINIIVVNSVKFFFEFLVWITPVPFLDACFEIANKVICAALIAVYAFSPVVALVLNVLLFVACLLVFFWIKRRELFYRTMLADWVLRWWRITITPDRTVTVPSRLTVFPHDTIGNIPARARCKFEKIESGWTLTHRRWLRAPVVESLSGSAEIDQGWWTNAIVFKDGVRLTFGSQLNEYLVELASAVGVGLGDVVAAADKQTGRQVDFV